MLEWPWWVHHQSPGTQAVAVRLEALSSTRRSSPAHFTLNVQQASKDLVKLEQNWNQPPPPELTLESTWSCWFSPFSFSARLRILSWKFDSEGFSSWISISTTHLLLHDVPADHHDLPEHVGLLLQGCLDDEHPWYFHRGWMTDYPNTCRLSNFCKRSFFERIAPIKFIAMTSMSEAHQLLELLVFTCSRKGGTILWKQQNMKSMNFTFCLCIEYWKIPGSYKLVAQLVIWIEMLSKIWEKYSNVQDPNLHDGNQHRQSQLQPLFLSLRASQRLSSMKRSIRSFNLSLRDSGNKTLRCEVEVLIFWNNPKPFNFFSLRFANHLKEDYLHNAHSLTS